MRLARFNAVALPLFLGFLGCSESGPGTSGASGGAFAAATGGVFGLGGVERSDAGGNSTGGQVGSGAGGSANGGSHGGGNGGSGSGGVVNGGAGSGDSPSTGGAKSTGGSAAATGGTNETGGMISTGGTTATGGTTRAGGSNQSGGAPSTGGAAADGSVTDAASGAGGSGSNGPCDIFATGNAPCVAAHSTVRLLLSTYSGPLYQVRRASDSKTQDIAFLAQIGVADAASQDTFCTGTTCTISIIYDQSGKGNHLKRSQGGAQVCQHQDLEAVASVLPLTLGGHQVYGIKVVSDNNGACTPPTGGEGTGYRLDKTTGVAIGDQPETEYIVTSGDYQSYQNSGCCFDYGNVETNDMDDGAATMEAVYFGGGAGWGHGGGNGPWVMADMENGIFPGSTSTYSGNTSVPYPYVTAVLIGRSGGNVQPQGRKCTKR